MSEDAAEAFISRKSKEAHAWRRALLDESGSIHADGKAILAGLMRFSDYFGPGYSVDSPNRTLVLAARREVVNRVLTVLDYDETKIRAAIAEMRENT
jgi:hypothetical protein